MARQLTPAVEAAIASGVTYPALFVLAEFDSGDVSLWSGVGPLAWDGRTWTGAGDLLSVETLEETDETVSRGSRVALNGMTAEILGLAYQEDYQGRPCTIWLGLLDGPDGAVIPDPVVLYRGEMDIIEDSEDGDDLRFILSVENALVALEKAPERTYTHEDQQELFPGDTFFKQVVEIGTLEIELE